MVLQFVWWLLMGSGGRGGDTVAVVVVAKCSDDVSGPSRPWAVVVREEGERGRTRTEAPPGYASFPFPLCPTLPLVNATRTNISLHALQTGTSHARLAAPAPPPRTLSLVLFILQDNTRRDYSYAAAARDKD